MDCRARVGLEGSGAEKGEMVAKVEEGYRVSEACLARMELEEMDLGSGGSMERRMAGRGWSGIR